MAGWGYYGAYGYNYNSWRRWDQGTFVSCKKGCIDARGKKCFTWVTNISKDSKMSCPACGTPWTESAKHHNITIPQNGKRNPPKGGASAWDNGPPSNTQKDKEEELERKKIQRAFELRAQGIELAEAAARAEKEV